MIVARRAAVRPRVCSCEGSCTLLDEAIGALVEAGAKGIVAVLGPPGSGKTTALEHLAAVLDVPVGVRLIENPHPTQICEDAVVINQGTGQTRLLENPDPARLCEAAGTHLVVYTAVGTWPVPHRATYQLAPWTQDDVIEYLLARHKGRCAEVMARLRPADAGLLQGLPDLWQIVLEELAGDSTLRDARHALDRYLAASLPDTDLQERGRSACLNALATPNNAIAQSVRSLVKPGFAGSLMRVLRHHCVQLVLATERVAADLRGEADCDFLAGRLPRDLIKAAAAEIGSDERAREHLHRLLAGPPWSHAMAASLLHASDAAWAPAPGSLKALAGAYLDGVSWKGVHLAHADLREADLSFADLSGADLSEANASRAFLRHANLHGACLVQFQAAEADLFRANLSEAVAEQACFDAAGLEGANFDESVLFRASFLGAGLGRATFRGADLTQAYFQEARIKDADFSGANLREAKLAGLVLREAQFQGADFSAAYLTGCDLEGMDLTGARFAFALLNSALLTASVMRGGDFSDANLSGAYLAEIDWEGASLCRANLRGASFHMGSSRSGLVGSPIACEGSRTGFYTDDYDEQPFKAPEEIRKANLRGADLRGACIDNVDFYLVDLRGARLDADQEARVRRCGAILEARV